MNPVEREEEEGGVAGGEEGSLRGAGGASVTFGLAPITSADLDLARSDPPAIASFLGLLKKLKPDPGDLRPLSGVPGGEDGTHCPGLPSGIGNRAAPLTSFPAVGRSPTLGDDVKKRVKEAGSLSDARLESLFWVFCEERIVTDQNEIECEASLRRRACCWDELTG